MGLYLIKEQQNHKTAEVGGLAQPLNPSKALDEHFF